jgi:centromeric protein E
MKLETERQALAAFVSKFDSLGLGGLGLPPISVSPISTTIPFNPPKPTPGGANAIFAERQKNRLLVGSMEPFKIAETNEPGPNSDTNVTESPLRPSTKTKLEHQPSLLEEEWEGVSMHAEDFESEAMMTVSAAAPVKDKRNSFLRSIGAEVKDAFGMGKENVPATVS